MAEPTTNGGRAAPGALDEDPGLRRLLAVARDELGTDVALTGPAGRLPAGMLRVPLRRADGSVRAVLGIAHPPADDSDQRLERVARLLARLLDDHLEASEAREKRRRQRLERIQAILRSGLLPIVYQPITDLASGEVVGVEALSRFPAPPDLTPDRWFAEAGTLGLGVPLEVLAVTRAVEALDRLPAHVYLSVNVSPAAAMSELLGRALRNVPLERLVLEITEHAEVADYDQLNRAVQRLRAGGARLAVDDTGSGFASMRHVLRLAPDIVKLDTSLTHDIDNDAVLRALGYSLKSFAVAIDAQVVAEGIETEREMEALRFLGVPFGQGYFLCPPGPLSETPALAEQDVTLTPTTPA